MEDFKSLIPETKLAVAQKALAATFSKSLSSIEVVSGGLSALVFKIGVDGRFYILRIVREVNHLTDPKRQYFCMNLAADAGITPRVLYEDMDDGVSISEFITTKQMQENYKLPAPRVLQFADVIKSIHALPLFPKLVNFLDGIDGFIERLKSFHFISESAFAEHFAGYAQIQKVYPRYDEDVVSSHNDLNPNNVLFDGEKIWIIDWEAAFQNDRYVDLAIVANFYSLDEAQEEVFLRHYFGDAYDRYKNARFFLMRQVAHMYYGMIMLMMAAGQRPPNTPLVDDTSAPSLSEYQEMVRAGHISRATFEGQLLYGKSLLNRMLADMKTERFTVAVNTVAAMHEKKDMP